MASETQYLELFHSCRALIDAGSCAPLNACRETAAAQLAATGLPSRKTERYKYTDAEADFAPDYGLNLKRTAPPADPQRYYQCGVNGLGAVTFFVVNDVVCPPTDRQLPEGLTVESLCSAAKKNDGFIERFYHRAAAEQADGITRLNTMLVQDGLLIRIAAGAHISAPVQIVNISTAGRAPLMSNRRLLVVAEEGAEATLLLCDHAEKGAAGLTTQVTEVFAGKDSRLQICSIEETHSLNTRYSHLYAEAEAGSRIACGCITLTNGRTRNTADIRLLGKGAAAETCGAVIADGKERVDNNLLIRHEAPECTSDMLYKYVLAGDSVGAFAGKVYVAPGAQKSLSQQTNANLCASKNARSYSQPMLEIYADDVKCNHGSTTGKLDETALFYMRQRGIEEAEARLLLQHAFINDVLLRVEPAPLRERLSQLVELRFRGELQKCKGCKMMCK